MNTWPCTLALAAGLAMTAPAQSQEAVAGSVWRTKGHWHSTECVPAQGSQALQRKLAFAQAARAIVRQRDGASLSGNEHLRAGEYSEHIEEHVFGVLSRLEIVQENSQKFQGVELWCVTVAETK